MISLDPGLYVTATPIGNLGDITYRAVMALKSADLILCEDTRQTAKLCTAYDIKTPRSPYHDHNGERARPGILEKLQAGARICLVSDAGTPLIADPGYKLVKEARALGVAVYPLPGASAVIAALSAAGTPTDQFTFAGFPPAKKGGRHSFLESLKNAHGTIVIYEGGTRITDTLGAMADIFGRDRPVIIARELTKLHEEFHEGTLCALAEHYEERPAKGEFVIILPPAEDVKATPLDVDTFLTTALSSMSVKEAAEAAASTLNISKRDAYQRALSLKEGK